MCSVLFIDLTCRLGDTISMTSLNVVMVTVEYKRGLSVCRLWSPVDLKCFLRAVDTCILSIPYFDLFFHVPFTVLLDLSDMSLAKINNITVYSKL